MALKFFDGFDHYATADLLKKWTAGTTGNTITANGRSGGFALTGTLAGSTWLSRTIGGAQDTMIVGMAVKPTNSMSGSSALGLIRFLEGATVHVSITTDGTGVINAYRGSGTTLLGSSAAGVLTTGSFLYVEAKVKVHDTTGTVEVRVNGVTVLTLTGQDTRNAGASGIIDTINVGPFASINPQPTYIDDVYVCDTTGTASNDFLSDAVVETLFPDGDGNYTQLTPSTGPTHYTLVDESTPNTTDYNSSNTAGNKDTYTMGAMSGSFTVHGVQVLVAALKDSASASSASTTVRSGSTDADGTSTALATTQSYLRDIWATDPATAAAWTQSAVNALEAGMKVTVSGASARNSQTVVEVLRSVAASSPPANKSSYFFLMSA